MSRLGGSSALKRKPDSSSPSGYLSVQERLIYDAIRSRKDMGIWSRDLKLETKLTDTMVSKSLKSLKDKNLIKDVVPFQFKGKKHYMASEFEPSKEITGGSWYTEGSLDTECIDTLKGQCVKLISNQRVAALEEFSDAIRRSGIFKVEFSSQQIEEILRALVLDDEIVELKSNGMGEFGSIPVGKVCYKRTKKAGKGGPIITGAMASIPCGVCPVISDCTPDGIVSPKTCKYYSEWLQF